MAGPKTWVTRGFDAFSRGSMGSAGHNLYVSRAGVLQRIHQFDLNGDGYLDLVFSNDHNHGEKPPALCYRDPLGRCEAIEIPADGARAGTVADLNGDGYDDLVIGNFHNGLRPDLNAFVYYGGPDGFSERRHQVLPAPKAVSVASGDFDGSGRPALAFLCQVESRSTQRYLRLFNQSELGFEMKRFTDQDLDAEQIDAADLDADGYDDLIARAQSGQLTIFWGGPGGLSAARSSTVPGTGATAAEEKSLDDLAAYLADAPPLARAVTLRGVPHLFAASQDSAALVPVTPDREFGHPLTFAVQNPMAVAVADLRGNGSQDIVLACREPHGDAQALLGLLGRRRRLRRDSPHAAGHLHGLRRSAGDLDGDGADELVLCQMRAGSSYDTEAIVYRCGPGAQLREARRLHAEEPRRVFIPGSPDGEPAQLVFVNHRSRNLHGDIDSIIYWGGPDGFSEKSRQAIPGFRAVDALYTDVNDDGRPDLVICNSFANTPDISPGSYVLLNGPDGFPAEPSMTLPTDQAQGMVCADINRDGYLDLIFASIGSPDLVIFHGAPGGFDVDNPVRIRMERDGVLYDEPRWIYLADWNNDGWLDLFVPQIASDRSFILWGGPQGFAMDRLQMLSVWHAACARAADLDGNGYLDLVVGGHEPSEEGPHDSFAHVYWNGPDGLRDDNKTLLPGNAINSIAVADFDNDGRLDLFVASYHDGKQRDIDSYIYWQRDTGFSAADRTRMATHSASGSIAADFDGDGWTDLAIGYHRVEAEHRAHSAVWWNGPGGFSESRVTTLPTEGPHGISNVEPGSIADRGPEEHYVSPPFHLPPGEAVRDISWEASVPAGAWVEAHLRFADIRERPRHCPWLASQGSRQAIEGKWLQYRLTLGSDKGMSSPRVTGSNRSLRLGAHAVAGNGETGKGRATPRGVALCRGRPR